MVYKLLYFDLVLISFCTIQYVGKHFHLDMILKAPSLCTDFYDLFCFFVPQISKQNIDCLRFVIYLLLAQHFFLFFFFFAAATNSTSETNKAGGICHYSVYLSQMSMVCTKTTLSQLSLVCIIFKLPGYDIQFCNSTLIDIYCLGQSQISMTLCCTFQSDWF